MKMNAVSDTEFEAALSRLLDDEPEPGDGATVARAARQSPERLRRVSGLLALDDLLRQSFEPDARAFEDALFHRLDASSADDTFAVRVESAIQSRQKNRARVSWIANAVRLRWVAAVIALGLGAGVFWFRASRFVEPVAVLLNESSARFGPGASPPTARFMRGEYHLVEGAAHLRFRQGMELVVIGPARFRIEDFAHVHLREGSLRALIPETAQGFVVSVPGARFHDPGTDFGVSVHSDSARSELHVFAGQVEVFCEGAHLPSSTISGGQSVVVDAGRVRETAPASPDQYPTAESLALRRWNAARHQLRHDPNLVVYYPFTPDKADPTRLRDEAEHAHHVDGTIAGAQWVAGRWPGKHALQFENPNDAVELTIPGEFEELTLAAWIKVDRFENTLHAVLNSHGNQEGGIQWQFDRKGWPMNTWVESVPKRSTLFCNQRIPVGRWVHWAVTVKQERGRITHYLDGKLIGESGFVPGSARIVPGVAHLGHWQGRPSLTECRDFRGRIDELAVWNVALPASRIAAQAEEGKSVEIPEYRTMLSRR